MDQFLLDIAGVDADGDVRYRFPELNRIFIRDRAGRPWTSDGCRESGRRPGPVPAGPARSR